MMQSFDTATGTRRTDRRGTPLPEQPKAMQDAARLSENLFGEYARQQQTWSEQVILNMEMAENVVFTSAQKQIIEGRGLAPVAIPLWHQIEEQAVAMLCARTPRFQSLGTESSDDTLAALYADFMTHIWRTSSGDGLLRQMVKDEVTTSRGVLYVYPDFYADGGAGEIYLAALDPIEVFPDPASRKKDWSDCAHILVVRQMTREQLERAYPQHAELIGSLKSADGYSGGSYGYAGTNYGARAKTEGQVIGYGTQGTNLTGEAYEVVERYSKVRVRHVEVTEPARTSRGTRRRMLPNDPHHNVVGPVTFEAYAQEPVYEIRYDGIGGIGQGPVPVEYAIDDSEVAFYEDLHRRHGDIRSGNPVLVPIRMGEPEMIGGVAVPAPVLIATLYRRTKLDFLRAGLIEFRERTEERVQVTCSVGQVTLHQYVLPTGTYPLCPFHTQHRRNPYPTAVATLCRPMIEEYNKKQQAIIANMTGAMGQTWWARVGTLDANGGKDAVAQEIANPSAKILEYTGETPPIQAQHYPLAAQFFENQDRLKAQLFETTGFYPVMQGDQSSRPERETWKGTLHYDEASQRRTRQQQNDLYDTLNLAGRVVADLIPFVYRREKRLRLFDPDKQAEVTREVQRRFYNSYGEVVDLMDDASTRRYDLLVESGSTLPENRTARYMAQLELLSILAPMGGAAAGIILPEILRNAQVPHWEERLAEYYQNADLAAQLQQAQERIKALEGDMQTADRELRNMDRKVEREKVKSTLTRAEEGVKKEAELTRQRLGDQVNEVAQLQSLIDQLAQMSLPATQPDT